MVNNGTFSRAQNFANEPIPIIGMMQTSLDINGWRIEDAEFVVVKYGLKPLIGRERSVRGSRDIIVILIFDL